MVPEAGGGSSFEMKKSFPPDQCRSSYPPPNPTPSFQFDLAHPLRAQEASSLILLIFPRFVAVLVDLSSVSDQVDAPLTSSRLLPGQGLDGVC